MSIKLQAVAPGWQAGSGRGPSGGGGSFFSILEVRLADLAIHVQDLTAGAAGWAPRWQATVAPSASTKRSSFPVGGFTSNAQRCMSPSPSGGEGRNMAVWRCALALRHPRCLKVSPAGRRTAGRSHRQPALGRGLILAASNLGPMGMTNLNSCQLRTRYG